MDSFSDYLHEIAMKLGIDKQTLWQQILMLVHERKKSADDILILLKYLSEKL